MDFVREEEEKRVLSIAGYAGTCLGYCVCTRSVSQVNGKEV